MYGECRPQHNQDFKSRVDELYDRAPNGTGKDSNDSLVRTAYRIDDCDAGA